MLCANRQKTSLIVSNCEETEGICDTQHIYRYDFVDGQYTGKEKILTTKTSDLRLDLGNNQIYRNRYLITNWGDVIDINAKKVLHKSIGELVEVDGDNIVIKVNRVDVEGVFTYNLLNGNYTRLKSPNIYEVESSISPDKKFIANFRYGKGIIFKEFNSGKEKNVKGSFGVGLSEAANEFGKLPLFWLDNDRILTQKSNGDIVVVYKNGRVEPIVKIDIKESPYVSPVFYRNSDGEIIYDCYNSYVIDIANKNFRDYESYPLGFGFLAKDDENVKSNFGTGKIYFYKNTEIGKIWSTDATSTNNFIAVIYGKDGTNLGYPDGVKVWSDLKKDWTTLEIKWSPQIIGWFSE